VACGGEAVGGNGDEMFENNEILSPVGVECNRNKKSVGSDNAYISKR
jgi:hypothetical protein